MVGRNYKRVYYGRNDTGGGEFWTRVVKTTARRAAVNKFPNWVKGNIEEVEEYILT